jgi:hypothetical protein
MSVRSSASLESLDTPSREEIIQQTAALFETLKQHASELRDQLKSFQKRYVDVGLSERQFDPKPHAVPWFQARGLKTPCGLVEFLDDFVAVLAADCRICHSSRTVMLKDEEAQLFGLQAGTYKWLEILIRLPTIFY